jgi:hypothetical protein
LAFTIRILPDFKRRLYILQCDISVKNSFYPAEEPRLKGGRLEKGETSPPPVSSYRFAPTKVERKS